MIGSLMGMTQRRSWNAALHIQLSSLSDRAWLIAGSNSLWKLQRIRPTRPSDRYTTPGSDLRASSLIMQVAFLRGACWAA